MPSEEQTLKALFKEFIEELKKSNTFAEEEQEGRKKTITVGITLGKALHSLLRMAQNQEKALVSNNTLLTIVNKNNVNLRRAIGGFDESLQNVIALQNQGFREIGEGTVNLANKLTLTNQNQALLIATNKALFGAGQLTEQAINVLNKEIDRTAERFEIAAGSIVESIGDLQRLSLFGALGSTQSLTGAVGQLVGMVGEANREALTGFLNNILNPQGDLALLGRAGILGNVNQLLQRGLTKEGAVDNIITALTQFSSRFENLLGEGGLFSARIAGTVFPGGEIASQLVNSLERNREVLEAEIQIQKSLNAIVGRLLTPLSEITSIIAGSLLEFLGDNTDILKALSAAIPVAVGIFVGSAASLTAALTRLTLILSPTGGIIGAILGIGAAIVVSNKIQSGMDESLKKLEALESARERREESKEIQARQVETSRFAQETAMNIQRSLGAVIFGNSMLQELADVSKDTRDLIREHILATKELKQAPARVGNL